MYRNRPRCTASNSLTGLRTNNGRGKYRYIHVTYNLYDTSKALIKSKWAKVILKRGRIYIMNFFTISVLKLIMTI